MTRAVPALGYIISFRNYSSVTGGREGERESRAFYKGNALLDSTELGSCTGSASTSSRAPATMLSAPPPSWVEGRLVFVGHSFKGQVKIPVKLKVHVP